MLLSLKSHVYTITYTSPVEFYYYIKIQIIDFNFFISLNLFYIFIIPIKYVSVYILIPPVCIIPIKYIFIYIYPIYLYYSHQINIFLYIFSSLLSDAYMSFMYLSLLDF